MLTNPQNPYESFLLEASAGSGKTYQLTGRFLKLVSSGTPINQILAITFTKKACAEMRARIISEASSLLYDKKKQDDFNSNMLKFHNYSNNFFQKPLPAIEVAKKILAGTQCLKILTIDSLLLDWTQRFCIEMSDDPTKGPFQMMETFQINEINEQAWEDLFSEKNIIKLLKTFYIISQVNLLDLKKLIFSIFKNQTKIWQWEEKKQNWKANLEPSDSPYNHIDELWVALQTDVMIILQETTKFDLLAENVRHGMIDSLIREGFLTKNYTISKVLLRGKKREKIQSIIDVFESSFQKFFDKLKIENLNIKSKLLFSLYSAWVEKRENLKTKSNCKEFSDLIFQSYPLINNSHFAGSKWMIQKSFSHILFDEFQDTSFLQWELFFPLFEEMLAQEEIFQTVFIVGDKKQSIYGFREADPAVFEAAKVLFQRFEKPIVSINFSFRSSQIICDFVNSLFENYFDRNFPTHTTARINDSDVVENQGGIFVHRLFEKKSDNPKSPLEQEAYFVASKIKEMIENADQYPVYDRHSKNLRAFKPSDLVILYRSASHVDIFEYYLEQFQVPFSRAEKSGLFLKPEIKDVMYLLQFMTYPSDLLALISFLKSPFCGLEDLEMNVILNSLEVREITNKSKVFIESLLEKHDNIKNFLLNALDKSPLAHELILDYWSIILRPLLTQESSSVQKNILKLAEICINLQNKGIGDLAKCFEKLKIYELQDDIGAFDDQRNSITLMTIHKSKGLEFPFVCLVETAENWFQEDSYWLKWDEKIYFSGKKDEQPTLSNEFDFLVTATQKRFYEESIRLLYVALTRASHYLMITGHKAQKPSDKAFFSFLFETVFSFSEKDVKDQDFIYFRKNSLKEITNPSVIDKQNNLNLEFNKIEIKGSEISIINPHKKDSAPEIESNQSKYSQNVAKQLGVFIHLSLENIISKKPIDYDYWWYLSVEKPIPYWEKLYKPLEWQKIKNQMILEIEKNIKAVEAFFEEHYIIEKFPEMPLCCFYENKLMIGVCDLVLISQDTVFIFDYKTTKPPEENLANFCNISGFSKQLSNYEFVLRNIYPGKKVRKFVWFTKIVAGIEI